MSELSIRQFFQFSTFQFSIKEIVNCQLWIIIGFLPRTFPVATPFLPRSYSLAIGLLLRTLPVPSGLLSAYHRLAIDLLSPYYPLTTPLLARTFCLTWYVFSNFKFQLPHLPWTYLATILYLQKRQNSLFFLPLWILNSELWIIHCQLWIVNYELWKYMGK